MKRNKIWLLIAVVATLSLGFGMIILIGSHKLNRKYNQNLNQFVGGIIHHIQATYPEVDEETIIKLLNNNEEAEDTFFKKYGIDLEWGSILKTDENLARQQYIFLAVAIGIYTLAIACCILLYQRQRNRKLAEITEYLKKLNQHQYHLDIDTNSEDELSFLKNEIYKTAVTLNEQAALLKQDKVNLKKSLEDISHQLKTPLTSIGITIDNLLEDGQMEPDTRREFLRNVHRKLKSIQFLVQSLLELSRFDANMVTFHNGYYPMELLAGDAIENVAALCDLKNITITVQGETETMLFCDYKWQLEAVTNILKNCVEHSPNDSQIEMGYRSNDVFVELSVRDYGEGMDREDAKHIFERFYKGKHASKDSVGIGMALAKTIVEQNNGRIILRTEQGKGSTFLLRWFRYHA